MKKLKLTAISLALVSTLFFGCKRESKTVKVGILHSFTGTMSMSEIPVANATKMAIDEINESGGVLGKKIVVIQEDGQSDAEIFAEKAKKLLEKDKVATVFGCWTSASRKAVKPIFEENYGLLWYPLQYEGIETSPNIMYLGAPPNQQVLPSVDFSIKNFGKDFFLLGSDYVFPQTINKIIKAKLLSEKANCVGELYVPLGTDDFSEIIETIKKRKPSVILNSLNGSSNIYFFKQLKEAGITPEKIPVMSYSISEADVKEIGTDFVKGNYIAWNYFSTTNTPQNQEFVKNYKEAFGDDVVTGDPIEAAFIAVHLWAAACEKAGTFDVESVRIAAKGIEYTAPEGSVVIDGGNQHLFKHVRIGKINEEGLVDEVWSTPDLIRPDPYLSTYGWARGL